jgi:hypothetical protein
MLLIVRSKILLGCSETEVLSSFLPRGLMERCVWSDAEEPFLELALSATNLDIVPLIARNGDRVLSHYISPQRMTL